MPPPAMLAHTGTCTPLTVGTQAVPTVPTGTSHRTGCSNAKLSRVTTRGTTASAAAPGPETPTEEVPPGLRIRSPRALRPPYVPTQTIRDEKKLPQNRLNQKQTETDAQFMKRSTVGLFLKYFQSHSSRLPVYLSRGDLMTSRFR